ncbi:MAG: 30S ribosomal protein S2 [Bacilli bacterium]|nr:30S ribosomal protein S2 [Bacilli bacterium]
MSETKKLEEAVVVEPTMEQVLPNMDLPVVTMKKLLEAGAHFGHQTRLWNPKMKPYIYGERNGVHIINLEKTVVKVEEAYEKLKDIVTRGGKVLFVGTRKAHAEFVKQEAERCGSFYINNRWLGGTLTNFRTILNRIRYLRELEMKEADGGFKHLNKKELARIRKEMERLTLNFEGIKEMRRVPEAVIVTSSIIEINAVKEARKLGIPVFGLIDTNCDPDVLDYIVPANDDATKTVQLFLQLMADAVAQAKGGLTVVAYTPDVETEIETLEQSLSKSHQLMDKDEEEEVRPAQQPQRIRKKKTEHSDKPKRQHHERKVEEHDDLLEDVESVEEVKKPKRSKKVEAKETTETPEVKKEAKPKKVKEPKVEGDVKTEEPKKKTVKKEVKETVKEEKVEEKKEEAKE